MRGWDPTGHPMRGWDPTEPPMKGWDPTGLPMKGWDPTEPRWEDETQPDCIWIGDYNYQICCPRGNFDLISLLVDFSLWIRASYDHILSSYAQRLLIRPYYSINNKRRLRHIFSEHVLCERTNSYKMAYFCPSTRLDQLYWPYSQSTSWKEDWPLCWCTCIRDAIHQCLLTTGRCYRSRVTQFHVSIIQSTSFTNVVIAVAWIIHHPLLQ